ncbi:MAG TPA: cell division protein ZapB [Spirochaetia bacterium]|nr:cell division protein ZapB [Spirochaetia bacterium]
MVNLEQIRLLESRVQHAISYIQTLREENRLLLEEAAGLREETARHGTEDSRLREENVTLRASLETYEKRIGDLERVVNDFKVGQEEIELTITNALKQLDQLEDTVLEEQGAPAAALSATHAEDAPTKTVISTEHTVSPGSLEPDDSAESFDAEVVDADISSDADILADTEESPSRDNSDSELDIF